MSARRFDFNSVIVVTTLLPCALLPACSAEPLSHGVGGAPLALEWSEQGKLLASDAAVGGDRFGTSVSISGDTAVVGAVDDNSSRGSAHVFVRSGSGWSQEQKLVASDGEIGDRFGVSVSVSGNTAVVGAHHDGDSGSAYVFVRTGGVWTEQQKLVASGQGQFGTSVSISGDLAIIGDVEWAGHCGSAYVFERSGGVWTQQQKLVASDAAADDWFGSSVSVSSNTAVVGAPLNDEAGSASGSAYVFVRGGGAWHEEQKLLADDAVTNDRFGTSVSVSGGTAVIGAPGANSAYVFVQSGEVWTEQQELQLTGGGYGAAVSVSGDIAVIGAPKDYSGSSPSGSAYVYGRADSVWTEQRKLVASDGALADTFGSSVGASGDTAIVGAPLNDDVATSSGSAYVFHLARELGDTCGADSQCTSGFCADGVCCDRACGGGDASDCEACSVAAGSHADGTCSPLAAATVCRATAGSCDVAESCDGANVECPFDARQPSGTECRALAGECDVAESCNGVNVECPFDARQPSGTECRPLAGECDVAETCDGANVECPFDARQPSGTECRALAGECDVTESCDGASPECPADSKLPAGAVCRAAADRCDLTETCNGMSSACGGDLHRPACCDCDDGDPCTVDTCSPLQCMHTSIDLCCTTDAQCTSGNACHAVACDLSTNTCATELLCGNDGTTSDASHGPSAQADPSASSSCSIGSPRKPVWFPWVLALLVSWTRAITRAPRAREDV